MVPQAYRRLCAGLAAAFLSLALVTPGAPALAQQHGPASVADLAERLMGAVVNISTSQNVGGSEGGGAVPMPQLPEGSPFQEFFDDFFRDQQGRGGSRRMQSLGSGFIIDGDEGLIVTNNHVITDADEIEVNLADGSSLKAELIGSDATTDLALLKVDPAGRTLTEVSFGDSDRMRIGDWVMAIGNPFGLGGTVTVGIISARDRDINAGPYDDFIQTDAAINRGNSGGPLFNMDGEVIGINTAIISPSGGSIGIGFSIPSELAVGVIEQLREFGRTRRGWLGVRIQPVTPEMAESLGMERAMGALIAGIIEGGPVENGPIEVGDVILRFGDKQIRQMRDLPRAVAESPVGEEVEVVLLRKGTEMTVRVTPGLLEDSQQASGADEEGEDAEVTVLGLTLGPVDDDARETYGLPQDVSGVVVTVVEPGSQAETKGIGEGSVILEINQESVSKPADAAARIDALRRQGRRNALLMLSQPDGEIRFVTLTIN